MGALTSASNGPVAPAPHQGSPAGPFEGAVGPAAWPHRRGPTPQPFESRVPHRGLPDAKAEGRKQGLVVASGRKSPVADQERRLDTLPPGSRSPQPSSSRTAALGAIPGQQQRRGLTAAQEDHNQ